MTGRLDRLREALPAGCASMLVTSGINVRYLTGFDSSNVALLVDPERVRLLTDGRYAEAARSVPGVELIHAQRDLIRDLSGRLSELTPGPVGFEADAVSFLQHRTLAESGVELAPCQGIVEALRAVKDPSELAATRRAATVLMGAFEALAAEQVAGRTEAELAWLLERTMRETGAQALSFAPIVASGPNAALPHHRTGSREVRAGDVLLVDAGCVVDGYCSDCTRTFAVGGLPPELERAYAACLQAQLASLAAVRAGAVGRDVDAIARQLLTDAGYEVVHGLGHGVGLQIHEGPRLADTSTSTLEPGNVVTVEPGVYLAGAGGVRIEDMVVVTDGEPEVLTPYTKELVTLR